MAVIGKIQKNSLLLLLVIGGAMLAFIFTDLLSNVGTGEEQTETANIAGEWNDNDEAKLTELNTSFLSRAKQTFYSNQDNQGKEFTGEQTAKDQAFNELVRRKLMNKELNALGLTVSAEELNDMVLGSHIHPWVASERSFQNSLGEFSKDSVLKYINFLELEPDGIDTAVYTNWTNAKKGWKRFEVEMADARKADKYVTLIKKGVYVNSLEAKNQYNGAQEKRNISFVIKRYADIKPEDVEFTDEDLLAYFNAHKNDNKYEVKDEQAIIDFVEFPVVATQYDLDDAIASLEGTKALFVKAENNLGFMYNKSDEAFYYDTVVFKMGTDKLILEAGNYTYPSVADEAIQTAKSGTVVGPFIALNSKNETISFIAKVGDFDPNGNEEQAWVRHILVSNTGRSEAAAKKRADSVVTVIKANNNFTEMVTKVSEDPGSISAGGEYKWFPKGRMVEAFENASFNGAKGKLQVVKTTYGYHIVEVLDRRIAKARIILPVVKNIKPSIATKQAIEDLAYEFIADVNDNQTDSAFNTVAVDKGLAIKKSNLSMKYTSANGFDKVESIKKFCFAKDAANNDVSDPILDKGFYKVAIIKNTMAQGVPNFEGVKNQMKLAAKKDKQAKYYMEQMAKTSDESNLQELVAKFPELKIQNAILTYNINTITGGGGNEPEAVGTIFSLPNDKAGSMLNPIKGVTGVYVVIVDEIIAAPETTDFTADKLSLTNIRASGVDQAVIKALRDKANVIDNRAKIDIQGR
jgi:peptidyl-prolyl cis-trans isomerase D